MSVRLRSCACLLLILIHVSSADSSSYLSRRSTNEKQNFWQDVGRKELEEAVNIKINENIAKNVILFVGDGMGPNTLTAARIYHGGENSRFSFEKFPHIGLLKTYSTDRMVPDSACTATALFTGVKTNFEVAGVDANVLLKDCSASLMPENQVESILSMAQKKNKDTGFVTTTRVTHATPSALYSHIPDRRWECDKTMVAGSGKCKDIARQLVEDEPGRNLKVIMGGGRQCLTWNVTSRPNDPIDTWTCRRADGLDLLQEWKDDKNRRKMNCRLLERTKDLRNLSVDNTDCVLGVFANGHMNYEFERDKTDTGQPSLTEMTKTAINLLKKSLDGFFLVVEGGLIDQAHHRGHARIALEEVASLNSAIQAAVELTDERDTLIIVTSDHSHNLNINGYPKRGENILGVAMNSKGDGVPFTTLTYSTGETRNYQYFADTSGRVQRLDPINQNTTSRQYFQQAGILNDEATHGGVDVAVFARGPMSHLFHGVHEQNYVAHVIQYAALVGLYEERNIPITGGTVPDFIPSVIILCSCLLYLIMIVL